MIGDLINLSEDFAVIPLTSWNSDPKAEGLICERVISPIGYAKIYRNDLRKNPIYGAIGYLVSQEVASWEVGHSIFIPQN